MVKRKGHGKIDVMYLVSDVVVITESTSKQTDEV